jgi:hypothetical protein
VRWTFPPSSISPFSLHDEADRSLGSQRTDGAQYPAYGDELKPLPVVKAPSRKELERIAAEEAREAEEVRLSFLSLPSVSR